MKYLYTLSLLLFVPLSVFSKHIIGGVVSYECLGGGVYKFTMKMYRDCSDLTGAGFDNLAPFTIFKGDQEIETVFVPPMVIEDVDPPTIPCLILPPNVCVEEGIYEFEYAFSDWPSDQSYHITYQRCCRNATIVNIQNPNDVGATFTIEILPASQVVCNNSPVFNTFPPIVICVDQPLNYDHSAFDIEGDQLVYDLCSPLLGGAPPGGGGGGGPCNVVAPNPACPPPYDEAIFINPPYTELVPMGGSPAVNIHPITGLLTGTPNAQGQFVFAVCVSEFRNGQLMSVIRRDFQFNVASCTALVDASVSASNIVLENDEYYLKTCNGLEINIENESQSQNNVDEYRWEFFTTDSLLVYDTWDLDALFPGSGHYNGMLILNPSDTLCGDTALINIDIFPEVVAEFSYEYDTCIAGPVTFIDASYIDGVGGISEKIWDFGDGIVDSIQNNPVHVYDQPQLVPVTLQVWDENDCFDEITENVTYFPVPSLILVKPNDTLTCPPAEITFTNLSSPIDDTYDIFWEFGDGEVSTDLSPSHVYRETGQYDVRLQIISPIGCMTDTIFTDLVRLTEPPVALFDYEPKELSNLEPEVQFFDQSLNAVHWDWFVNNKVVAQQQDFDYVFQDTGLQKVTLIITHPEFCQDSITKFIDVKPEITFYMPNAFTPNEDTNNEFFFGTGILPGISSYRMEIWDRWGQRVFETDAPGNGWNGRVENAGKLVQEGVYIYTVRFTGPRGAPHEYKGYATVIH